ncbi:TonB-dependent receptor [Sphingobacterium chuzhouense]|uniref:TonB-dependent receptor n=1 Tax=Sphingobacterium chuzhouense TaxID=1742264 RepID=A0ABR7XQZ0_9SPHI|nr:TonB-dependent receptor [Sphingobacterium chuzhouense]MBD1420949.1 TonB-dependent receptor [Sphingobacterium chuzhouense]
MKLIALFLTIASLQVSANSYAQNVTIRAEKESFKSILRKIRKQTGKDFLYNTREVNENQIVNFTVRNEPWLKALHQLLYSQNLKYKINGNTVLIQALPSEAMYATSEQQQTLKGTVRNTEGHAVVGATVTLVESGQSMATNERGEFVFEKAPNAGTLYINSLGYQPLSIQYTNTSVPDITLSSVLHEVEEVVVVGYGVQTKKELIGSVSSVDGEKLAKRSVPQLSQALTGQMPGVTVIQRSGQPGASGGEIQIRGVGSFGAGTGALILVDGIPTNSFNDIDPNDVASISVLKDASSAAIYGARAANGVILVTTKAGASQDKMVISYNGNWGLQTPTAFPEVVNSWEYATAINETVAGGGGYTKEEIQKFRDGSDPDNYANSDFIGEFFKSNAQQTGHNINLSNRNEKVQYTFSLGYLNQKGIVKKNDYDRYNARLNIITNIRDNLKLTTRLSAIQTTDDQPAVPATLDFARMDQLISQVVRYPSIYPIRMSNGDWGTGVVQKGTPISFLESQSFYKEQSSDIGGNMRLDWSVIPDLTLSAIGGYTQESIRTKLFRASQRVNDNIMLSPSSLQENRPYGSYKTFQALAEYRKQVAQHDFKVLAGYSFEKGYDEDLEAFRQNFPTNDLTEINVGSPDGQTNKGTASEWALESLFARLQYNFAQRYLLEGVVRYDGSSRFPLAKKYAVFPSIAAGWLISEEHFMKDRVGWLNELKLKASYGVLGNQNMLYADGTANYYPYQNILVTGKDYAFGNTISPGVARTQIIDPSLRWESTRTADVGLEGSFLNRRLNFSATYYDRYTYDILVSPGASVSGVLGFEVGLQNSGKLKNSGWEFTLGYQDNIDDWTYGATLNFSTVKNRVRDLGVGNVNQPNGLVGNGSTLFIGHPMQMYYGYKTDGLFVDEADVASWIDMTAVNPNPQPGDVRYLDISGPDGVPDGKVDPVYDRTFLGSRIPKYSYGMNLNIGYKNIDLGVLLQGVSGVSGMLNNHAGWALYGNGNIQRWQYEERWRPDNPNRNAAYPRMEQLASIGSPNTVVSDYWILNASYLRVRNIQLGYTLPKSITDRLKVEGIRLHANAENLFTWHNYRQGWDPEINTGGTYYPIMRNFSFGVNLNF